MPPRSVVAFVARAVNGAGAGERSNPPTRGLELEDLNVERAALPAAPGPSRAPAVDEGRLTTRDGASSFVLGAANGPLYPHMGFRLPAGTPGADKSGLRGP